MLDATGRLKLGIDFGTTHTVVSVCDRGNYPVVSFTGASGETSDFYPSLIAVRGAEVRTGFGALEVRDDPSFESARSMKRLLSNPHGSEAGSLLKAAHGLDQLLVAFLRGLLGDLAACSNVAEEVQRATTIEAMIAAPANAQGVQRFLTLDAFRRAGFSVVGMINEPSAAAFEYAQRYRSTFNARREHLAVYDLGGGTFDASVLQMTGRVHQVLRARGIGRLGGDDFDRVLAERALDRAGVAASALSSATWRRLCEHCRELKERLHPSSRRLVVDVANCLDDPDSEAEPVTVAVSEYYEACAPLIARTLEALSEILPHDRPDPLPEDPAALSSSTRPSLPGLAGIYVVGGASALPAVARALKDRFGRRVHRSPHLSAAVAIGLAIALDERAGYALEDRFSRVLGVFREDDCGRAITFDAIIGADAALPVRGSTQVLERRYRAAHNIGHFRFVECSRVDALGQPSGEITPYADVLFPFASDLRSDSVNLGGVPVSRSPGQGPEIRERYLVDSAGLVELIITDLDTGYEQRVTLGS